MQLSVILILCIIVVTIFVANKSLVFSRSFKQPNGKKVFIKDHIMIGNLVNCTRYMDIQGMAGHYSCIPLFSINNSLLIYEYCELFMLTEINNPKKCLILGGGGGTVVRYILKRYPSAVVEVVEINGLYIELSKKYFLKTFKNDDRLIFYHVDGEKFINEIPQNKNYDFIFCDLFNEESIVDFILTINFHNKLLNSLNCAGLIIINLGKTELDICKKLLNKVKAVYPYIYLMKYKNSNILVCKKSNFRSICAE